MLTIRTQNYCFFPICANAAITVSGSSLTVINANAPLCEVPTLNTGTLTLTDVTLSVASNMLLYVDYNTQWSTYGGTGNLVLLTTQDAWSYTGNVDADSYSNVTVTVGENVTWNGAVDTDNNASSANVTVNEGAVWVLTANAYVNKLVNNGIITNGYTLKAKATTGTGTQQTTPVDEVVIDQSALTNQPVSVYTIDGQYVGTTDVSTIHGVYIINGKKVLF